MRRASGPYPENWVHDLEVERLHAREHELPPWKEQPSAAELAAEEEDHIGPPRDHEWSS